MKSYLDLLRHVLCYGETRKDRTGVGTIGVFGYQWRHKLSEGFPLLTTKKVHFHSVKIELLWFLRGETNIRFLKENNVKIWNEWADEKGELGPVYGKQWRFWDSHDGETIDQISQLIHSLKQTPYSRRHIVTAWNPADVPRMKLPPCHTLWQCRVSNRGELDLHLYARSIDSFLGLPFNIASYALLLLLLAKVSDLQPGELIISFGDLHIYSNHMAQVQEQLNRKPKPLPRVVIDSKLKFLGELTPESITLHDYFPDAAIKAPVAV